MRPKISFMSYGSKIPKEKEEINIYKAIFKLLFFYSCIIIYQFSIEINTVKKLLYFEPILNKSPP